MVDAETAERRRLEERLDTVTAELAAARRDVEEAADAPVVARETESASAAAADAQPDNTGAPEAPGIEAADEGLSAMERALAAAGIDADTAAEIKRRRDSLTMSEMYLRDEKNQFLEVTYQNGDKELMYFMDFSSGAMIENIVRRAKKLAIKRLINHGDRGIRLDDLIASIHQEYKEHEDLPNTTNPDDWAKISGKKGERIVYVRTLVTRDDGEVATGGRSIERVATGQYL